MTEYLTADIDVRDFDDREILFEGHKKWVPGPFHIVFPNYYQDGAAAMAQEDLSSRIGWTTVDDSGFETYWLMPLGSIRAWKQK